MSHRGWVMLGALCWALTLLYFVVELIVAAAWPVPYSFSTNAISDLGITACGNTTQLGGTVVFVCSPRHALMNASFVAVGILFVAGTLLTRPLWPRRRLATVALGFLVLVGVGSVLVGLAPANENLAVHRLGVLLQLPGALAPLLLGLVSWGRGRWFVVVSVTCGAVGTLATLLFAVQLYLGLGLGAMERLAFDPLTAWTAVAGTTVLASRSATAPFRGGRLE